VKPKAGESTLVIHALLDSQSLTGAYRFELRPGAVTNMEIEAEIFPRRPVAKLGIAPLTSMFLFGEAGGAPARDYRPEVHDSDGLLLQNGDGERIWRPLVNPRSLSIAAFRLENPRLLALLQRDRNFDHYQDLESQYQRRPSAWIEPVGDWNSGRAELVQIPADRDIYDNVVSFWVPKEKIKADRSIRFRYRLSWSLDASADHVAGRAVATRWAPHSEERKTQFIVDFDVNGTSASAIDGVVTATEGAIGNLTIQPNPGIGTRLAFDLTPHGNDPVELRGFLRAGGNVLSETWSYAWPV
jgi:glucans biosynthesis protein